MTSRKYPKNINSQIIYVAKKCQEENKRLRQALESIVFGGNWLAQLEQEQDPAFPLMPLAYSRDCYRIAKNALKGVINEN